MAFVAAGAVRLRRGAAAERDVAPRVPSGLRAGAGRCRPPLTCSAASVNPPSDQKAAPSSPKPQNAQDRSRLKAKFAVGGVLLLASLLVLAKCLPASTLQHLTAASTSLSTWIDAKGPLFGPVLLAALQAVVCCLGMPSVWFTLTAGYLYGPWTGFLVSYVAKVAGATLAFLLGRFLFRDPIDAWLAGRPQMAALVSSASKEGWKLVLALRLGPVPNSMCSYLLSVTDVSLRTYFLTSLIGIMPSVIQVVAVGSAMGSKAGWVAKLSILGFAACIFLAVRVVKGAATAMVDKAAGTSRT